MFCPFLFSGNFLALYLYHELPDKVDCPLDMDVLCTCKGKEVTSMRLRFSFCILLILAYGMATPLAATSNAIGEVDCEIFRYIHEDLQNRFLDGFTPRVQKIIGDGHFYAAICLSLCAFGNERKAETGRLATVAFLEMGLTVKLIKRVVGRPRPLNKEATDSFPSGHTATAFAMATIISDRHPRLRIPIYAIALGTAFSRVYGGHHYPSDVIVGAAIGTLAGMHAIHLKDPIIGFSF